MAPQPSPSQAAQPQTQGRRYAVAAFVLMANMMQMISNCVGIGGGLELARLLGVENAHEANWAAASYPLTQGTFVLVSGRLGAVYGHGKILMVGGAWFILWTLVNAFCPNFIAFNIVRGLSGMGGALILPNAVAIIGTTFPPGKARNLCLGIFGAAAPIGGYVGSILAGVFTQFTSWRYLFGTLAMASVVVFGILWFLLPKEKIVDPDGKVDWVGAALGSSGLILFNFVWNQAPAVGWSNPYEIALLITSIVVVCTFVVWEKKGTTSPIMPLDIWKAPSFKPLVLVTLLAYMAFGIQLWYMALWQQITRGWSVLEFAVGWTPFVIFGVFAAWLASWLVPRMPAQWILGLGISSVAIASILLATMPDQQTYWAQVFPATIVMAFCPDFIFTAAQIIASNTVRRTEQGVAASLIGVLNLYGNSIGLGFAGTIETQIDIGQPDGSVWGYRVALFFGCGIAILALALDLIFVRMGKSDQQGWPDEDDVIPENQMRERTEAV